MNSGLFTRTFVPDLEVPAKGDGRTVCGIAVPYNKPQRIDARLTEMFAPYAFRAQINAPHRVRFSREHLAFGGTLIGKAILLREDAAGLYGEWRVSDTPVGNETLELLKDGVLTQLSIGFREKQNRRLEGGIIERTTAHLIEVSVTLEGAYGDDAIVSEVRNQADRDASDYFARLEEAKRILNSLPRNLPIA